MRPKQTEIAVLGALSIEPMTGYALREQIREVLGHFWSESFGQIYPALAELERRGDVERHGSARRGASTFAITPSGLRRLLELLEQPVQSMPPRNGLLLRLFFGRVLGAEACRRLLLDAKSEAERRLTEFEAIRREIEADDHERERPFWLLTVAAGEHGARATVAWADEALASLEHIDASEPTWRKGDTR
jgi:DNA-binding PadR family transcriptional regulator